MKKYLYILAAMFFGATVLTGCSDDDNATPKPGPTPAVETDVVDLGLPSGTLWATANLGAEEAQQKGNLYAWAETYTKSNFSQSNYFDPSSTIVTSNITGTEYDAAKAALGGEWIMPTEEQFEELFDECKVSVVDANDGSGKILKLIGPNEKVLYLPAVTADVEGEGTLYDFYVDDKGKDTYVKFENVYAAYWTGSIAPSDPQNVNQYAVQALFVEHAKEAVKKADYDQYGAVLYNRSRLAGAAIRPVKANGGTPISQYVDITGKWAQCDASGNVIDLDEDPVFLSFEGTNYSGDGVQVEYGQSYGEFTYSRNINELFITDEEGESTTAIVADVKTVSNEESDEVLRVISVASEGETMYFIQTEEVPEVDVDDLAGKWDFEYEGTTYTINILDDENCTIKVKGSDAKYGARYNYRFGTFDLETEIFNGTFAVEPIVGGSCPFRFVGGDNTIVTLVEHPKSYETLFSWNGGTETTAPSVFTLNSNNSLLEDTGDGKNIKKDIYDINGDYIYTHAVRLNKSVGSTTVGTASADAANISTLAALVSYKFKTGDRIRVRGFFNKANTSGSYKVFNSKGIFLGVGDPGLANYADGDRNVSESVFIFTADTENVYLSRQAGTGTFICEFYIDREIDD